MTNGFDDEDFQIQINDDATMREEFKQQVAMEQHAEQEIDKLMDARIEVEMDAHRDPVIHRQLYLLTNAFAAADDRGDIPVVHEDRDHRFARYRYHAITAVAVARLATRDGFQ